MLGTTEKGMKKAILGSMKRYRQKADYMRSLTIVKDTAEKVRTLKWRNAEYIATRADGR